MSHPLPARRRLALLAAVLAALALAAGFAWRSTPVPVQNTAYAFACPRSVSVQTQGDRSTFWVEGTQEGGIDCYPALPWETLTQGLWTVPLPTGTLAASDPLFSAYLLECSALGQPVTLQEAGGRTHTLYFSPAGACYDLWLDPGSPAPADLSAIRASFTLLRGPFPANAAALGRCVFRLAPRLCGGVSCFWDKLFPHGAQFPLVQSYCQ